MQTLDVRPGVVAWLGEWQRVRFGSSLRFLLWWVAPDDFGSGPGVKYVAVRQTTRGHYAESRGRVGPTRVTADEARADAEAYAERAWGQP